MGGNAILNFRTFCEGGNARVGELAADRVDFSKVDRQKLIKQVVGNLKTANNDFKKQFGYPLWNKESYITSGAVMSGSSKTFVDTTISDEEYKKHKPSMGDIDLQVDKNFNDDVSKFLTPGRKFGTMTYKGRVKSDFGTQIISLMYFPDWDIHIQMDWEMVDFTSLGMPTDWSAFSHSSAWEDMKIGVKGVFHKYIVGAVDMGWESTETILTPKGTKHSEKIVHPFAFSVDKGVRPKYREATDEEKVKLNIKGTAFVPLPTKDSKYTKDIGKVFSMLFRKTASSADLKKFNSFVGIVGLIKKLPTVSQNKIYGAYLERLWGKSSQQLYRGDPKRDAAEKGASADYFEKQIPAVKSQSATREKMVADYYEKYKK